jgi:hypothetical protein
MPGSLVDYGETSGIADCASQAQKQSIDVAPTGNKTAMSDTPSNHRRPTTRAVVRTGPRGGRQLYFTGRIDTLLRHALKLNGVRWRGDRGNAYSVSARNWPHVFNVLADAGVAVEAESERGDDR